MKATTLLVTLGVAMAAFGISRGQGGPPQGGPGGQGRPGFGGPGGPGMMNGGIPPLDRLVFRHDVQEDIQITDDQKSKLDELRPKRGPGGPGGQGGPGGPPPGGQGGPPPFDEQGGPPQGGQGGPGGQRRDRKAMEAQHAKLVEAIKAILTSEQMARVKEIGIQLAGGRAVLDKEIQSQLGISADQKTQSDSLVKAQQAANQGLREKMDNGDLDPQQLREMMQQNDKAFQAKLTTILTSDQSSKLKTMGGKPFKATDPERGPGGPGGGFGGPPPGGGFGGGGR